VAGKSPQISKPNSAATYNIEMVMTSRPSHPNKEICGAETNNTLQSLIARKEKKYYRDGRPKVIVLGDSRARGIASELMHQSNHHLSTIGYVKPNAKFIDLINTVNSELCKLTKSDTIILFGGSNDIGKSVHGNNLTSIRNFLEGTQNTNVIILEVLVRYDTGARSNINEQIDSFNKKLHKVIKSFMHVKLIKVTTNREDFTKHGLHLNSRGKEKMSKKLLKHLSTPQKKKVAEAIHLPWKSESTVEDIQTVKTVKPNNVPNISIGASDRKDTDIQNVQQGDNHGIGNNSISSIKEISRNLKPQRNCPKVKNDDFLWN